MLSVRGAVPPELSAVAWQPALPPAPPAWLEPLGLPLSVRVGLLLHALLALRPVRGDLPPARTTALRAQWYARLGGGRVRAEWAAYVAQPPPALPRSLREERGHGGWLPPALRARITDKEALRLQLVQSQSSLAQRRADEAEGEAGEGEEAEGAEGEGEAEAFT